MNILWQGVPRPPRPKWSKTTPVDLHTQQTAELPIHQSKKLQTLRTTPLRL